MAKSRLSVIVKKVRIMFYISEEELRFKKDTNPDFENEKLCHVFMTELFNLKNLYPCLF